MRKYILVCIFFVSACLACADAKKEEYTEDAVKKMYLKIDNLTIQKKYTEAFNICNKIESYLKARYNNEKDILSAVLLTRSYIVKSRVCCYTNDLTQAVSLMRKAVELYGKFPYLKQSSQYPKLKALLKEREIMLNNIYYSSLIEEVHKLYDSGKYVDAEKITLSLLI